MGRHRKIKLIEDELLEERIAQDKIDKCLRKRKVKTCKQCCRYKECYNGARPEMGDNEVATLVGAIVFYALQDLNTKIPSKNKCKTRIQKEHRKKVIYDKASAQAFFKSDFFRLMNLNFAYLERTYKKYYGKEKV